MSLRICLLAGLMTTSAILLPAPSRAADSDLFERANFRGDFRLRYESIDREGASGRDRYRYRLRLGGDVDVYDDIRLIVSLATAADNLISRNVTFGGNEIDSDFGVDLAYVDWRVNDVLDFQAGKMLNPMYHPGKAQLVYDNDLNPGGVAARFASGAWFVNTAIAWIQERGAEDDSTLYHVQAGLVMPLAAGMKLTAGVGYLAITNTVGNLPFIYALPAGNTVDADGRYVYEYTDAEIYAALDTTLGGLPLQFFAHYVENVEVSNEDTAYAVGILIGKAKQRGEWQAGWHYKDVGADAVVGSFTESDFGGGGTDVEGHVLNARYLLRDGLSLGGTVFLNDAGAYHGNPHDYRRLQLDLEFKFD
jgi:Putative porin